MIRGLACLAAFVAAIPVRAADEEPAKDKIKRQKLEVQLLPYRDEGRPDPFQVQVPLRTFSERDALRVRIGTLNLSSVVVGRRKVAIFSEVGGVRYAYVLVNGVLIGPDHKPVPGVAGTIEPAGFRGEYRVVLKQGGERIQYVFREPDVTRRQVLTNRAMQAARTRAGGGADGTATSRYTSKRRPQ